MPILAHVSSRKVGSKIYGVIWSLPPELIGKKVYVLTEEEWSKIEAYLKLLDEVLERKVKEEKSKVVKQILSSTLENLKLIKKS